MSPLERFREGMPINLLLIGASLLFLALAIFSAILPDVKTPDLSEQPSSEPPSPERIKRTKRINQLALALCTLCIIGGLCLSLAGELLGIIGFFLSIFGAIGLFFIGKVMTHNMEAEKYIEYRKKF